MPSLHPPRAALLLAAVLACRGAPAPAPETPRFTALTAGEYHTCALAADSTAWCWGVNRAGKLGDSTTTDRLLPTRVHGGQRFTTITAGGGHTCALDPDGRAWCWGRNTRGELGNGTDDGRLVPSPSAGDLRFTAVAAGHEFTCGLTARGEAHCWGAADDGQLGNGDTRASEQMTPMRVRSTVAFTGLAVGWRHACGLDRDGHAWCWGSGGALGDGTLDDRPTPVRVRTDRRFVALSLGAALSCGLTASGEAWCWGAPASGQLGRGAIVPEPLLPGKVTGDRPWRALGAGRYRACALDLEGAAWCWGSNYLGALGTGDGRDAPAPVAVTTPERFARIASGDAHSCALTGDGIAWCWGMNASAVGAGMLGDGTMQSRTMPVRVGG